MNRPAEWTGTPLLVHDRPRQAWIDFARGIGVILVVYGHMLGGLVRADLFPRGPLYDRMDYALYTFHMPLFFFLTGLNVPHSLRRGTGPFLTSKLWTLAYPYVLWSLIQGGLAMLLANDANTPIRPGDLLAIGYRPIAQFWFLYALLICHLLAVVLPGRAVLAVAAAAGFVVFEVLPVRPDLALTLHHLPFYAAGVLFSHEVLDWRPGGRRAWLGVAAIWMGFAAAVALGLLVPGRDEQGVSALPEAVLGIVGIVLLSKLLDARRHGWLARIGTMSMTIYVLHIMAGSGIRIMLQKLHVPAQPWVYLPVVTAAGVGLPMLAHLILQQLRLLGPLGLAPLQLRRPVRS